MLPAVRADARWHDWLGLKKLLPVAYVYAAIPLVGNFLTVRNLFESTAAWLLTRAQSLTAQGSGTSSVHQTHARRAADYITAVDYPCYHDD